MNRILACKAQTYFQSNNILSTLFTLGLLAFGIRTASSQLDVIATLSGTVVMCTLTMKSHMNTRHYRGDCGFHCWYVAVCHSEETNLLQERAEDSEAAEGKCGKLYVHFERTRLQHRCEMSSFVQYYQSISIFNICGVYIR